MIRVWVERDHSFAHLTMLIRAESIREALGTVEKHYLGRTAQVVFPTLRRSSSGVLSKGGIKSRIARKG